MYVATLDIFHCVFVLFSVCGLIPLLFFRFYWGYSFINRLSSVYKLFYMCLAPYFFKIFERHDDWCMS